MEKHNNSLECMKNCYAIFFFDNYELYYALEAKMFNEMFLFANFIWYYAWKLKIANWFSCFYN